MGLEGAKAIGEALVTNNVLEDLNVSNNRISAEGAVTLAKGRYLSIISIALSSTVL